MVKYFWFLLFAFTLSYGQDYVQGQGKFYTSEEDSLSFIKDELVHQGFLDVINKELIRNSLSAELFWQKFEEKFIESFQPVEDTLKEKFNSKENPSSEDKELFQKDLRKKKILAKRRFGNLASLITSYSLKKPSRSIQNPELRYLKLEAKVDQNLLTKTYYLFVQGKKTGDYGTLFIDVDYNLLNSSYTELGITNQQDFADVVNAEWLKWFSKNKPDNIKNVEILSGDNLRIFNEYSKLPYERMILEIPPAFINSLYLKINVNIKKLNYVSDFNQFVFEFDGAMFLKDLQNSQVLSSFNFNKQTKSYPITENSKISNYIATFVYRMPIGEFSKLNNSIKNVQPMSSIQRIAIYDFANIAIINELIENLKGRGVKYSLDAKLESIGKEVAELIVFYDGNKDNLKEVLSGIKAAKIGQSFDLIDSDTVIGIKFNSLD